MTQALSNNGIVPKHFYNGALNPRIETFMGVSDGRFSCFCASRFSRYLRTPYVGWSFRISMRHCKIWFDTKIQELKQPSYECHKCLHTGHDAPQCGKSDGSRQLNKGIGFLSQVLVLTSRVTTNTEIMQLYVTWTRKGVHKLLLFW